ncbi:MAG: DUF6788 family protein [Chloroflexota bacterium]
MRDVLARASLSPAERDLRSRVAQLVSGSWFLRGTLSERSGKCGKPTCHCAKGELHQSLYLVQSHAGKPRQICVPQAWQTRIRQAVADYQQLQRLMEEVSELEWKRLKERKR